MGGTSSNKGSKGKSKDSKSAKKNKDAKLKHARQTKSTDCKFGNKTVKNGPCCKQKFDVWAQDNVGYTEDPLLAWPGTGPYIPLYASTSAATSWWIPGCLATSNGSAAASDGAGGLPPNLGVVDGTADPTVTAPFGILVRPSAFTEGTGVFGSYYPVTGHDAAGNDTFDTTAAPLSGKFTVKGNPSKPKIVPFGGVFRTSTSDAAVPTYIPPASSELKSADTYSKGAKGLVPQLTVAFRIVALVATVGASVGLGAWLLLWAVGAPLSSWWASQTAADAAAAPAASSSTLSLPSP